MLKSRLAYRNRQNAINAIIIAVQEKKCCHWNIFCSTCNMELKDFACTPKELVIMLWNENSRKSCKEGSGHTFLIKESNNAIGILDYVYCTYAFTPISECD